MTGQLSATHFYYETLYYRDDYYVFPNGDPDHPPYNPGEYCDGAEVFTDYADCAHFKINGQEVATFEYAWMIICQTEKVNDNANPLLAKDRVANGSIRKVFLVNRVNRSVK